MKVIISSRKSDLARIQACFVGETLSKHHPHLKIEYQFRESLGDKNLTDPLWKMPEKGVFTEDFTHALLNAEVDLVVHSWKDLPVELAKGTEIRATLDRADQRDLLIIKKSAWKKCVDTSSIKIFSSSPRRQYQVKKRLAEFLPVENPSAFSVETIDIRGNLPTRLKKLFESEDVSALILAKAGVQRLLEAQGEEFSKTRNFIASRLRECYLQLLPLSSFPTAAAQGALAIQIRTDNQRVADLLDCLKSNNKMALVERERKILKFFGGGCHQKIGVSIIHHPLLNEVIFLNGQSDQGEILDESESVSRSTIPALSKFSQETLDQEYFSELQSIEDAWPIDSKKASLFERKTIKTEPAALSNKFVWVSRSNALPMDCAPHDCELWAGGTETWKSLARRGFWVSGCADSLGEKYSMTHPSLKAWSAKTLAAPKEIVKLSHDEAPANDSIKFLATYTLLPKEDISFLENKSYYFWMSYSAFELSVARYPEILKAHHASGPGNTAERLREKFKNSDRFRIFISHESWLKTLKNSLESK